MADAWHRLKAAVMANVPTSLSARFWLVWSSLLVLTLVVLVGLWVSHASRQETASRATYAVQSVTPPTEPVDANPAGTQAPPPTLDPTAIADAKRVQQRLVELGFLTGTPDGVWGTKSRRALQDFRIAHGLGKDDGWDERTEREMFVGLALQSRHVNATFIGEWTPDGQCAAPLKINTRAAETKGGRCDFNSIEREGEGAWRIQARCSMGSAPWAANIQLALKGPRLTWTSEKGTTRYFRCPVLAPWLYPPGWLETFKDTSG
jgi:peptidoglycan hydrolase-like protein with peptidoglycan-binding domain